MAAIDSTGYRRSDLTLASINMHRRATVGSPPSFTYSNTFESPRPSSRAGRLNSDFPYRVRRSTVSGHGHSHNPDDVVVPPAAQSNVMLSDSASPSPIMHNATLFPGASPTPSSDSPRHSHSSFDYEHSAFSHSLHSPLQPSFALCPSPEFQTNLNHPRSMPPPSLPATFSSGSIPTMRSFTSNGSASASSSGLSPATSLTLDSTMEPPNLSPRLAHDSSLSTMTRERLEAEIMHYRYRVRELEFFNDLHRLRIAELESADNKARIQNELGLFVSELPPPAGSAEEWILPADWATRTAVRIKRFCGLNRAGNALCAWHDSRRERRAYPPRMAPSNMLNCGCTFSQALFEESLARNRVGAFYPGENVRMDPALRNPLLKLLEERYGYRDGDFERRPNGTWREGEDAQSWEQRVSGRGNSRRER